MKGALQALMTCVMSAGRVADRSVSEGANSLPAQVFIFFSIDGDLDCPNFRFSEIEMDWDCPNFSLKKSKGIWATLRFIFYKSDSLQSIV